MKVLILDDQPQRHITVKNVLIRELNQPESSFTWFHANTYIEAVELVRNLKKQNQKFDIMALDHDLADWDPDTATRSFAASGYAGSDAAKFMTGADFCHHIVDQDQVAPHVWVHSWNFAGARHMKNILQTAINPPTVLVDPVKN